MTEIDDELATIVDARVGQTVCAGKYRIDAVLGLGGMASVYAGVHRNGRRVAMKFLHPEYSRRSDIRKRFIREAQAANAVEHAGVVAVIDDDVTEDGVAFLVMERLEGKTLEALWEELGHRLPARAVLAIGRELCSILAAAHRAGIVHRDIKPENVFLTNDGVLKVLDFGLAQLRDAARPKDTHTGMVFGTPAFMPPEQASGQTSQIDARTDLWAVGATMFTLLSGEMVHTGETAQHFVLLSATKPARSLAAVLPHAHPGLVHLVDRALTRDKEMRWPSADAMLEAIRGASQLVLGEADVPLPKLSELARRHPAFPPETTALDEKTTIEHTTVTEPMPTTGENSSAPPTQPKLKVVVGGASDTPTEQTAPDELPTQIRHIPDSVLDSEESSHPDRAMRKRASWSDLRRAIGQTEDTALLQASTARHEKLPILSEGSAKDQTSPIRPRLHSPHSVLVTAPANAHAYAMPQGHPSPPALTPMPSASARNMKTIAPNNRQRVNPYLPIVLAATFVGLTPLALFLAQDRGSRVSPVSEAQPELTATAIPPATVAEQVPTTAAPMVRVDAGVGHTTAPTNINSSFIPAPRVATATAHASASAMPSARASSSCTPPYDLDSTGIKHWKLECVEP